MTNPLRTTDFFTLEAGECLNRLEALLSRPEGVSGEEFVRQVRLLRGAALMANLHPVAQAGAAFEALARAVRDGQRAWDAATRELTLQVVDDFRGLVRRVGEWGDGDTARARRIAADLERLTGAAPSSASAATGGGNQTGVRAFVAREGALIASALDRASRALRTATDVHEALHAVLRRMQPLRGLAELSELPPLPEILDGVELVAGDLSRAFAPPPGAEDVLESAAQALVRVCREVTDIGRPAVDAPEARRFTDLLLRTFADERDVVPIENLLAQGEIAPGPDAGAASPLGAVELVSHGEHLGQVADRISAARTGTERDLRLFSLLASLRTLATGGRGQVPEISDWAAAARARIADGSAAAAIGVFVELLRNAGTLLRQSAGQTGIDTAAWRRELGALDALGGMTVEAVTVVEAAVLVESVTVASIDDFDDLLQADAIIAADGPSLEIDTEAEEIVPIESLAPEPESATFMAAVLGVSAAPTRFEASLISYADLLHELGIVDAPLEELVGVSTMAPERLPDPEPVVSIDDLLYRGTPALRRAADLQVEMRAQLARGQHIAVLRPLLDELLDLVPLALDGA
jgi:hypothetical protein